MNNSEKMIAKSPSIKKWKNRVANTLSVLEKSAAEQKYKNSYTADKVKLIKNLIVFELDDPSITWKIIDIDDEITIKKGIITLSCEGKESIKKHPTKLYAFQEKAINACLKDMETMRKAILRDTKEQLDRLNLSDRTKKLKKIKNELRKSRRTSSKV